MCIKENKHFFKILYCGYIYTLLYITTSKDMFKPIFYLISTYLIKLNKLQSFSLRTASAYRAQIDHPTPEFYKCTSVNRINSF